MNITRPIIEHCVDVELEAARREHEEFHSLHEAYAVTLEEVEEAKEELEYIEEKMQDIWECAKSDDEECADTALKLLERSAVGLAAEAVQVAAMARKARNPSVCCGRHLPLQGRQEDKTWFGKE